MSTIDFTPLQSAPDSLPLKLRWKQAIASGKWIFLLRVGQALAFESIVLAFLGIGFGRLGLIVAAGVLFPTSIVLFAAYVWLAFVRNLTASPSLDSLLPAFAAANGLAFEARGFSPQYPAGMFQTGTQREARNHISSRTGRYFDFGEYHRLPGEGGGVAEFGFIAIHLGRRMPHMVLEAHLPDIPGFEFPFEFSKDQVLSLEGDFNHSFTLYCPKEYERDALYFFTPDLMALCVDLAGGLHVEVLDEWMFFYAPKRFVALAVPEYQSIFAIIDLIGEKAAKQSRNYVDERVASEEARHIANSVAPGGQRLRQSPRGWSGLAIMGAAFVAGFQFAAVAGLFPGPR